MFKFPKTPRIAYTLKLPNTHQDWKHFHTVIQEKVDGANSGISFGKDGELLLQSRGHYLRGGPRERQFDLLKQWANSNVDYLYSILEDKYVLYGEWLYAKHHIFYDALPHYFLAYDLYDIKEDKFLSSTRRVRILKDGPVHMVPVLHEDRFDKINNFTQYIKPTSFKTKDWKAKLIEIGTEKELAHTDPSDLMEGVYARIEDENWLIGRMKHPREDFSKQIDDDTHWMTREIVANQLRPGVVL